MRFGQTDAIQTHAPAGQPSEHRLGEERKHEIARIEDEIARVVSGSAADNAASLRRALRAAARLRVVTDNLAACMPRPRAVTARTLVLYADQCVLRASDGTERALTYSAEATMRRFEPVDAGEPADPQYPE